MAVIEIPGYIIKRELGSSANASVLLAQQASLDREVAIKVLAPALVADKAQTDRFLQIARMLASFAHPNIVAVYDVGTTQDGTPYYSMQYLPGGDFISRAERGISEPDLTETLASVARALGYIHDRGLVHRAVTPHNVLYDAYNTPVLIDFGIAPAQSQDAYATSAGFAVEAGRYMSPEQARGGEQTARSDIYSLGALCFFGLTGRPPYDGADGFAVAYAHVFEPIPRLPPAKAHWQSLVDRALAKDPKDRYAGIEEFLDALTKVGLDHPPTAVVEETLPAAADQPVASDEERPAPEPAAPPPAERPPVAATITAPKAARREPAPTKATGTRPAWVRAWPLAVAALGVILIAVAVLLPRRIPETAPGNTAASSPAAPAAPSESATTPPSAQEPPATPAANVPADTAAAASTQPGATAAPAQAEGAAPAAPVDALGSIDAAEAQAEAEWADPAKAPTVVDPLNEAIKLGRIDLAGQRLTSPPGSNALERFQFALKLEPKSRSARQGIVDIAKKYIELAEKNPPDKGSGGAVYSAYGQQLQHADDIARLVPEGADVQKEIASRRRKATEPLLAQAKAAAEAWDKVAAKSAYELALQVDPDNGAAREGLKVVPTIGEPGFVFRDKLSDGAQAPPMVVVAGAAIAMARHPVTRGEFRRFWEAAGRAQFSGKELSCRDRESIFRSSKKRSWENPDIAQDDNHPVVCVGWPEAAAYAQWLAQQTGKRYRLPSPAEFDAVAGRAPRADCTTANLADASFNRQFESRDGSACDDGFAATAPVERFPAIAGVYDIDGNVREWVAACGNGSPAAPGSSCRDFRVHGRAWLSPAKESATASDSFAADVSLNTVGFRVARDLTK